MASEDPPAIWVSYWRAQVTSWKMPSCHAAYTVNLVLCRGNITCMELILLRNKTFRSLEKRNAMFMSMPGVLADLLKLYSRIISSQALERHG